MSTNTNKSKSTRRARRSYESTPRDRRAARNDHELRVRISSHHERGMFLRCTLPNGKTKVKTLGHVSERFAERSAGEWEAELNANIDAIMEDKKTSLRWDAFVERFFSEACATRSKAFAGVCRTVTNSVTRILKPKKLDDVTAAAISKWQLALRDEVSPNSIETYSCHLRMMLKWAARMDLWAKAPHIEMPKDTDDAPRGRPLTDSEVESMVSAIPEVVQDVKSRPAYERFIRGMVLSGLRVNEAFALTWDSPTGFSIDMTKKYPLFRISAASQKSRRTQLLPMAPDFAQFLQETPKSQRTGKVFVTPYTRNHLAMLTNSRAVVMVISDIGRAAGIVTKYNEAGEPTKYASCHDLRRTFAMRWSRKVPPAVLRELMRHADIATTMRYYAVSDAEDTAKFVWEIYGGNDQVSIKSLFPSRDDVPDSTDGDANPRSKRAKAAAARPRLGTKKAARNRPK